jgi:hypothetical protein
MLKNLNGKRRSTTPPAGSRPTRTSESDDWPRLSPFASASRPYHHGRQAVTVGVLAKLSQVIKVKDKEMLSSAIALAAQKGWLMVGGQPIHSVLLTDKGEAVAFKKCGHSNAPAHRAY